MINYRLWPFVVKQGHNFWVDPKAFDYFTGKKLLGLDFGEKKVGTSFLLVGSDPFPLLGPQIFRNAQFQLNLNELIDEEAIDCLIVGIPYLTDGQKTSTTTKAKNFVQHLFSAHPQLELYEQDETLSTFEAKDRMKNSARFDFKVDLKRLDSMAASIILEDFLSQKDFQLKLYKGPAL